MYKAVIVSHSMMIHIHQPIVWQWSSHMTIKCYVTIH